MNPLPLDHPDVRWAAEADPAAARLLAVIAAAYAHLPPEARPQIDPAELRRVTAEAPQPDPHAWAERESGAPSWPPIDSGRWPDHAERAPWPRGDGRVAVVVPARGRASLLARALASVAGQSFDGWTCVVVLAGRAAASGSHLDALGPYLADPRFLVLARSDLVGVAGPVNAGLAAVPAEFAAVLDDEDEWAPEFLSRLVDVLESDRTLGLAYGDATYPAGDADGEGLTRGRGFHPAMNGGLFRHAVARGNWLGWSQAVWRPELLGPEGLAAEAGSAADTDAWLRLAMVGGVHHVGVPLTARHGPASHQGTSPGPIGAGLAWVAEGVRSGRYGAPPPVEEEPGPEPERRGCCGGQPVAAPVKVPSRACRFLGAAVRDEAGRQEMRLCSSCQGSVRMKVWECGHPGHAADPTTTERQCRRCPDYEEIGT